MNSTVSKRQLDFWHPTHLVDSTITTILQYQTYIEHRDCSVDDDITISFYPFRHRKDCLYLFSRPLAVTPPESDSFCSLFNFTTTTFPGLLLGPKVRSCVFSLSFLSSSFSVRGSFGFWERIAFLFCLQLHVTGDFVFCFDYISIWLCISNQRLVPCNQPDTPTLQDTPTWDGSKLHESCHHDSPTVAQGEGPRRVVSVRHTPPGNRIESVPYNIRRGHTSQVQDGMVTREWAHI